MMGAWGDDPSDYIAKGADAWRDEEKGLLNGILWGLAGMIFVGVVISGIAWANGASWKWLVAGLTWGLTALYGVFAWIEHQQ